MILIGQYDSPFTRRVGIALRLYGLGFQHRPWSVFADAEKIRALNPLVRVPVLVLDDGFVLTDSAAILDHLDSLVPADLALMPRDGPARREVMQVTALATGLAEKAVGLFYERVFHPQVAPDWAARLAGQLDGTLAALDRGRAQRPGPWWFDRLTHADIAIACAVRFVTEAHPAIAAPVRFLNLLNHAAKMEELPAFAEIFQTFVPPA